jgi:virginiamycin B lyase
MKPDRIAKLVLSLLGVLALTAALVPVLASATVLSQPAGAPGEQQSLGGKATFAKALTVGPEGKVWFAGTRLGDPAGGLAGSVGPSSPPAQPAAEALAKGPELAGIAAGPDGNLWMTAPTANAIVRMSPSGSLTTFSLAAVAPGLVKPTGIVTGADGALWFTAEGSSAIGRITTDGKITAYQLPPNSAPHAIAAGGEGQIWFTEPGTASIGRIASNGEVASFPLPGSGGKPNGITRGPENNLWFTETGAPRIGTVTLAGQITEFDAEAAGPIVAGSDGNLWFGSPEGIGSISPGGLLGATYHVLHEAGTVESLAVGSEGKLWFGAHAEARNGGGGSSLISLDQPGVVGTFAVPAPTLSLAKNAKGQGAAWAQVRVTCTGGAAAQPCGGTLRVRARGAQVASRDYSSFTEETRWVAVKLSAAALKALAHGPLQAQVTVTGGGATTTAPVLLHRPPSLKHRR